MDHDFDRDLQRPQLVANPHFARQICDAAASMHKPLSFKQRFYRFWDDSLTNLFRPTPVLAFASTAAVICLIFILSWPAEQSQPITDDFALSPYALFYDESSEMI